MLGAGQRFALPSSPAALSAPLDRCPGSAGSSCYRSSRLAIKRAPGRLSGGMIPVSGGRCQSQAPVPRGAIFSGWEWRREMQRALRTLGKRDKLRDRDGVGSAVVAIAAIADAEVQAAGA